MRLTIWLVAAVVGLVGVGVGVWQLAAQSDEEGIPAPNGTVAYAPPGSTPRVVNGHVPPVDASPTPTPDLSNAVSPEEARTRLSDIPQVKAILDAVEAGDVHRLLSLIAWEAQPCGSPQGQTESCSDGVEADTELPMVNVSDSEPYWVTADTLGSMLDEILSGGSLQLDFAAASGQVYRIGLEGAPRAARNWGSLTSLTGVFLVIDSGSDLPLLSLSPLTPEWSAVHQGGNLGTGFIGQKIISFSTPTTPTQ